MISFKTKEDILPSTLILISLILLTAAMIYMLLVPDPTTADAVAARKTSIRTISMDILYSRKRADEARAAVEPRLWQGTQNHIGAAVLALVTQNAQQNSLTLSAFRPERVADLDGITELPYSVQLAGPFSSVRTIMRSFDGPGSRVVLRSVQVNASEEVTNTVTATLVISAYVASPATSSSTIETGGMSNG